MWYKLIQSTDISVIGPVDSQAEQAEYPVHRDDPNLSRAYFLKEAANPDQVITPTPILVKRAILTDMIGGSAIGNGIQRMLSDKLKTILADQCHSGLQFFRMSIIYKGIELKDYWLSNPFKFDMDCINYGQSEFEKRNLTRDEQIKFDLHEEFESFVNPLQWPDSVLITKVVLTHSKKNVNLRLLRYVNGGIGYYVSNYLKNEIEDAGCTGMEFEPVEEL